MSKVVYVATRKKQTFDISKDRAGDVSCECGDFIERRYCEHIKEYYERQMAHEKGRY